MAVEYAVGQIWRGLRPFRAAFKAECLTGDEYAVTRVDGEWVDVVNLRTGDKIEMSKSSTMATNMTFVRNIELSVKQDAKCVCSSQQIFTVGCRCGYLKPYGESTPT